MEEEAVRKIVKDSVMALKKEMSVEMDKIREENRKGKEEMQILKEENKKLKKQMVEMIATVDDIEQYSRKDSLILGGGGFPEVPEGKFEAPEETREVTKKVIEEKLGVKLNGNISACHRLRNNRRVIIKFQDLDDRNAVYQAKFDQNNQGQGKRIVIHENLTAKRAKQIQVLGDMWEKNEIANYHTRNGMIMARKTKEQRYAAVRADLTREEILKVVQEAPIRKQEPTQNQTPANIPGGRVGQRADLKDYVLTRSRGGGGRGRGRGSGTD